MKNNGPIPSEYFRSAMQFVKKRKRSAMILFLALFFVIAFNLYIFWPGRELKPISRKAQYDRIQVGMTFEEVNQIMGKQFGPLPEDAYGMSFGDIEGYGVSMWNGDDIHVRVLTDMNTHRVVKKESQNVIYVQRSRFQKICRWLGL